MKQIIVSTAIAAIALTVYPGIGAAQFGKLGASVSGTLGGDKSGSSGDMSAAQDQLVNSYVDANGKVLAANQHFAAALGLQVDALNRKASADALSKSGISEQDTAVSESSAAVAAALQSGANLNSSESKVAYTKGLVAMAQGLVKYKGMTDAAQSFTTGLSSLSPMMVTKVQTGAYVAKNLPTSVTNASSTLKAAIAFARAQGVEVPAEATDLF